MQKERIDEVTNAKKQIQDGSLIVWRTRLETLNDMGDVRGVMDLLRRPTEALEDTNNGCNPGCNNVAGCGVRPSGEVILGEPTITPG